jgi:[acyl-carrier-protein] S-malonyltransferase
VTFAILCSGQGTQHPEMFALTGDAPEAASLFSHAASLLGGADPRALVKGQAQGDTHQNRTGQILCTLQPLAAVAALGSALPARLIIAGYSVGEIAGWSIAGLIDAPAALDLVACRAEAMDRASPPGDGLLFLRGLAQDMVEDLCRRHDAAIAIVNPGEAFVLGGAGAALDALAIEATERGALRVGRLHVHVASHTPRLAAASAEFRQALTEAPVRPKPIPGRRLLSGIDGGTVGNIATGLDKLAGQISHTVRWADCLESCVESGATGFLELGPGRALSDMVAAAYPGIPARSLDEFRTLDGVRNWLARLP